MNRISLRPKSAAKVPLPARHKSFVRTVTTTGALSVGVPDSYKKKPSRTLRLGGSILFFNRPLRSSRQGRKESK